MGELLLYFGTIVLGCLLIKIVVLLMKTDTKLNYTQRSRPSMYVRRGVSERAGLYSPRLYTHSFTASFIVEFGDFFCYTLHSG